MAMKYINAPPIQSVSIIIVLNRRENMLSPSSGIAPVRKTTQARHPPKMASFAGREIKILVNPNRQIAMK